MRGVFLGVGLFMIGMLIWASVKMGFFKEVSITEQDYPEILMVYQDHIGPYHKILDTLTRIEDWAKSQNIDCSKSFGHFLDDPDVVEHERLRSRVGCVVDHPIEELPADFKFTIIPGGRYFIAEFSGSPAIGPMKVYRKARQKFVERNLNPPEDVIEIYDVNPTDKSMKTHFLFRIN